MKSIKEVYICRNRGPWIAPAWLEEKAGSREMNIINSRQCEAFQHKMNKDCDFYVSDNCITYYCPTNGEFVIDYVKKSIIG